MLSTSKFLTGAIKLFPKKQITALVACPTRLYNEEGAEYRGGERRQRSQSSFGEDRPDRKPREGGSGGY